jgi:hypothetical protein
MDEQNVERATEDALDQAGVIPLPLQKLEELARVLLGADTVDGVLTRIVYAARVLIPNADVVSITLRRGEDDHYTHARTDDIAQELDRLQYAFDQGPCLDAADPEGPAYAHSGDLAGDSPWPEFGPAVAEQGYRSVLSTALLTSPSPASFTGALNIYARDSDDFGDYARDVAFVLATYASFAIATVKEREGFEHKLTKARQEVENLRKALDTRTVIGQATGILMARRSLTADEAFEVLARASQNHNVKLADLANLLTGRPEIADRL